MFKTEEGNRDESVYQFCYELHITHKIHKVQVDQGE